MSDLLKRLENNLKRLESQNGQEIVVKGKRVGPHISSSDNMVSGITLSDNNKEAKDQENYEKSLLGQLDNNLSEEERQGVIEKYIDSLIDEIFDR